MAKRKTAPEREEAERIDAFIDTDDYNPASTIRGTPGYEFNYYEIDPSNIFKPFFDRPLSERFAEIRNIFDPVKQKTYTRGRNLDYFKANAGAAGIYSQNGFPKYDNKGDQLIKANLSMPTATHDAFGRSTKHAYGHSERVNMLDLLNDYIPDNVQGEIPKPVVKYGPFQLNQLKGILTDANIYKTFLERYPAPNNPSIVKMWSERPPCTDGAFGDNCSSFIDRILPKDSSYYYLEGTYDRRNPDSRKLIYDVNKEVADAYRKYKIYQGNKRPAKGLKNLEDEKQDKFSIYRAPTGDITTTGSSSTPSIPSLLSDTSQSLNSEGEYSDLTPLEQLINFNPDPISLPTISSTLSGIGSSLSNPLNSSLSSNSSSSATAFNTSSSISGDDRYGLPSTPILGLSPFVTSTSIPSSGTLASALNPTPFGGTDALSSGSGKLNTNKFAIKRQNPVTTPPGSSSTLTLPTSSQRGDKAPGLRQVSSSSPIFPPQGRGSSSFSTSSSGSTISNPPYNPSSSRGTSFAPAQPMLPTQSSTSFVGINPASHATPFTNLSSGPTLPVYRPPYNIPSSTSGYNTPSSGTSRTVRPQLNYVWDRGRKMVRLDNGNLIPWEDYHKWYG
jgi:hypothetical protein